jgi:cytochrome b6-f complex iron-sulfur subunit
MDRKEFLSMFGISAAAITLAACAQGCGKAPITKTAPVVDITLDLTASSNAALTKNGGYMYIQGVIVARTNTGTYIAVSQACTHQGTSVVYSGANDEFICPAHGSYFGPTGVVGQGPANVSLKAYNTAVTGQRLHIWG